MYIKLTTPNYTKGREGFGIEGVVLHITDSGSTSAINTFQNPTSQRSAHYVVDEIGKVFQLVDETDTAWHCGLVSNPKRALLQSGINQNLVTVGVEVATKGYPASIAQWLSWARLVKDICLRKFLVSPKMSRAFFPLPESRKFHRKPPPKF